MSVESSHLQPGPQRFLKATRSQLRSIGSPWREPGEERQRTGKPGNNSARSPCCGRTGSPSKYLLSILSN